VQRVAEDAGGSVTYAPRNPRGSTFTIALPAAVAAIAAQR
jgi:signal transduction histidine kinase